LGGGDWNDGMNRVGIEGEGESVWLGWFIGSALQQFATLCQRRGDTAEALFRLINPIYRADSAAKANGYKV
jgi:cellobiose phosphorylase